MAVRAKFVCQHPTKAQEEVGTVVLVAQYDPDLPEDQRYSKATPSGRLEMQVDNPPALAFFKPGQAYYLDFTEASS